MSMGKSERQEPLEGREDHRGLLLAIQKALDLLNVCEPLVEALPLRLEGLPAAAEAPPGGLHANCMGKLARLTEIVSTSSGKAVKRKENP